MEEKKRQEAQRQSNKDVELLAATPKSKSGVQIDKTGRFSSIVTDMAMLDVSKADKLQSNASPGFEQLWAKMCPEAKDYVQRVKAGISVVHREWEKKQVKKLELECPWMRNLRANQPKRTTPTAEFQQISAALREYNVAEERRYFRNCPKNDHYSCWFRCCTTRVWQQEWRCAEYGCEPSHIVWRYRPGPKYEDVSSVV